MPQGYYELSMRTLQLAGMSERTQECYTRAEHVLWPRSAGFPMNQPDFIPARPPLS